MVTRPLLWMGGNVGCMVIQVEKARRVSGRQGDIGSVK